MDERDFRSGLPDSLAEPVYREIAEDNTNARNKMAFKLKNKKSLSKYPYRGRKDFLEGLASVKEKQNEEHGQFKF